MPRLEKSLSEIGELKKMIVKLNERLLAKEEEVKEAISQNSSVLDQVFRGSEVALNELLAHGKEDQLIENPAGQVDIATDLGEAEKKAESVEIEMERVYFERDTNSALAQLLSDPVKAQMEETMAVDLTVKPLRDALAI
jgi:hypothetical protein